MQHHAYIYEGPLSLLPQLAQDAKSRLGLAKAGDPDVHVLQFEKFGIEESRALREQAALKSAANHALFVVGVSSITTESQQALLKLFEEPQAGSTFVLLAPRGSIIATLRSRLIAYPAALHEEESSSDAKKFLAASQSARSTEVTRLLKDDDMLKERVREFLAALEQALAKHMQNKDARSALADIAQVRSYVNDRSPALKMLLEHLALSLPTIKDGPL